MFRNPRESVTSSAGNSVLPSVGRPPTPPQNTSTVRNSSPYFGPWATPTPKLAGMKPQSVQSRTGSRNLANVRKPSLATSNPKTRPLPNQSILNFFAKSDRSEATTSTRADERDLFFQDPTTHSRVSSERDRSPTPVLDCDSDQITEADGHELRYNEVSSSIKRRRISSQESTDTQEGFGALQTVEPAEEKHTATDPGLARVGSSKSHSPHRKSRRQRGPFVEESDSEDEKDLVGSADDLIDGNHHSDVGLEGHALPRIGATDPQSSSVTPGKATGDELGIIDISAGFESKIAHQLDGAASPTTERPSLARESTSMGPLDEFNGMEDFEDEFFEGGEEFMERKWLEEQRMLEDGLDEDDSKSESAEDDPITPKQSSEQDLLRVEAATCPICNESMEGTTAAEASAHVNSCLDGNPTHLPANTKTSKRPDTSEVSVAIRGAKRFQRAAIARPGQENPFSHSKDASSSTAFSKLMSGHVEDAAWATAAANEVSSRGKPAYRRTCPFYKIMPGLYICVDAFRYGKVEGQNAYFLSHFHSDHYIGLTSSWSHGPIYCSKVTGNLVRQQLKVNAKWVVALEFEKKVEIPDTQGVSVTMIPANHCPGSSLFLFEKVVGKGTNPKINRILHCGDFRACPAHINHPLLRPDVVDAISGKTKQQVIDTCYLDTTYLTPKYAFPSQEDVIGSCAEMCVSLSNDIPDLNDGWERAKLERAGTGMAKFLDKGASEEGLLLKTAEESHVPKEESSPVKKEDNADIVKPSRRGRLLVVIGTYSIGKERVCLGIAKALNSKIYAPAPKQRICAALEDPELSSRLTTNPLEAQVHMQMLMEIRAETLLDYLQGYPGHFSRVVGFRPTGWNYRPPTSRFTENPAVSTVLHSDGWKSRFSMKDLVPQRGSGREASCFAVPYSEHSSFRELTMFCCGLRIGRVIPTVNVGSAKSREKMKGWIEKWELEKKKSGLFRVEEGATSW